MPPSIVDLARLSNAAYSEAPKVEGWNVARAIRPENAWFSAFIFHSASGPDHVVAYRGTNDWLDLASGAAIALGFMTAQFPRAESVMLLAKNLAGTRALYLTGHSLGGGLASMVAFKHRLPCVTFNAPGTYRSYAASGEPGPAIDPKDKSSVSVTRSGVSDILNIRARGDLVSIGAGPSLGSVRTVPNDRCAARVQQSLDVRRLLPALATAPVAYARCAHGMRHMLSTLQKTPEFSRPL